MPVGDVTKALVTKVKSRIGEDTEPGHFSQAQVIEWLDEAQRRLCIQGPVLNTVGYASTVQNVEFYTLPTDYYQMIRVEYRPTGGQARELEPWSFSRKKPGSNQGIPQGYGIWGANDANQNNMLVLWLDYVLASNGVDDLWIFYRSMPHVLSTTVDPEVAVHWQDFMVDYAEMMARQRLVAYDKTHQFPLQMARESWARGLQDAKRAAADVFSAPKAMYPIDNAGYTEEWP